MKAWLLAAAAYNLLWGAAVVVAPEALFAWAKMQLPRYPEIWQCVGMIIGPIGFGIALIQGVFPPRFGLAILTNDLIWWIPFTGNLWAARVKGPERNQDDKPPIQEASR